MKKIIYVIIFSGIILVFWLALNGRSTGQENINKLIEEIQNTPTKAENLREREMVVSLWAEKLRNKGANLGGTFEIKDREELHRLIQSDPEAAARKLDEAIQRLAALGKGNSAVTQPQNTAAPVKVTITYQLKDFRIIDLAEKSPANGRTAVLSEGKLTFELLESPVAVIPADWTGRSAGERSAVLGVLGDYFKDVVKHASDLGYKWVKLSGRKGLNWAVYRLGGPEIPAGERYLDIIEKDVVEAARAGLNVLLVIEPSTSKERRSGSFVKKDMKDWKISFAESDTGPYREFLKTVFSRFKSVKYYALGNEIDLYMQPEDYARALLATYDVMKKQCPSCELTTSGYLRDNGTVYFEKVLKALEGKKAFDHFDMRHVFGFYKESELLGREYSEARSLLDRYGYRGIDIWMTETSAPATMPGSPEASDKAQAVEVVRRHITAFALGIKKVFWTGVIDHHKFGGERQDYYNYVGLAHNPMNEGRSDTKPSYFAYRGLSDIISRVDLNSLERIEPGGKVVGYKMTAGNRPVYIFWRAE